MKKHTINGIPPAIYVPLLRPLIVGEETDNDRHMDRFARIAWSTIAEPGDGDAGALIAAFGAAAALQLVIGGSGDGQHVIDDDAWTAAVTRWTPRIGNGSLESAALAARQGARFDMKYLIPGDEHWPAQLEDLGAHTPYGLWTRGDTARLLSLNRSIAMVGARAATGYGEHVTIEFASGLVDRGFAIVSGGAYGIDGASHRAALASRGITVAVLAGGLDRFYPSGHEQLLTRIVDRGVVVAEVPPGASPTKWRFLLRNRLIAALANATVVVEAGHRSGSLNTGGHAATLGRPLGAVPGLVTSPASAGTHRLLREFDATCVTTPDEVAELVGPASPAAPDNSPAERADTDMWVRVLDSLTKSTPRRIERIAALSGLGADRVRAELGLLELDGRVVEHPSGWTKK